MAEFPHQMTRSLLLEYLKGKSGGQYLNVVEGVVTLAAEKGIIPCDGPPQHRRVLNLLARPDEWRIHEDIRQLLWQLIVQGVLVPGKDKNNQEWPWFTVTEYGKQVVAAQKPQPYDPDGFLEEFRRQNPNANPVVLDYLEEGVRAFNYGCFKAAAVMIGAASEKAILLLKDQFEANITDGAKKAAFEKDCKKSWAVTNQYRVLKDRLDKMADAKKLTRDLSETVAAELPGCFEMIRRQRNAAGHPDIVARHDPDSVFLNLRMMSEYMRGVHALIEYFHNHPADW